MVPQTAATASNRRRAPLATPVIDALIGANYGTGLIQKMVEWGITAGNWTAGGVQNEYTHSSVAAMVNMERFRWIVDEVRDLAVVIELAQDLESAFADGKYGLIMGFQGAEPIGSEFNLLSIFARLGLRILGLTYNDRNLVGDGCMEPEGRGLTHFGIEIVRECNRVGVVVDLSHACERTSLDAIQTSSQPCILSHSNPAALMPNPRNVSDHLLKELAAGGGVVGLAAWSNFVGSTEDGHHPNRGDLVRQIDYVVNTIGIDHVGIGSDIYIGMDHAAEWNNTTRRRYPEQCGGQTWERHNIAGYEDNSAMFSVGEELSALGYKDADIAKILGGNFYRLLLEVLPRRRLM